MTKLKKAPQLTLLFCALGLAATQGAFADETCSDSDSCLTSINTNTYNTSNASSNPVVSELQTNFAYGSSNFDAGTDLSDINGTIKTTSYMASRFFIQNLIMPVFTLANFSNVHWDIVISDASTYSAYLQGINDIGKNLALDNYFIPAANNGFNPITSLDIQSYAYPLVSQIAKNSLVSVTPPNFLNYIKASAATPNDIESKFQNYCAAQSAIFPHDNPNAICLQPFDQLNIAGGFGFLSLEGQTDDVGTRFSTTLPSYWDFIQQNASNQVLPSITATSLISPLTYQNDAASDQYSLPLDTTLGLYGRTEISAADNFIRYLSGELLPNGLSTSDEYQMYYNIATGSACYQYRLDAAMKIKAYRVMLRNYAAQVSVGTSNLYHLMQKRRPIADSGNATSKTSQLEQEYKMATYRLFNPDSATNQKTTEWQDRLATASSASIQRQMALLLAEINYQLFLNRQDQERILMVLSAMHLNNTAQMKKGLNIGEASTYISSIQTANLSTDTQCATEDLSSSEE